MRAPTYACFFLFLCDGDIYCALWKLSLQYTVGPWKTHRQTGIGFPALLSEDEGWVLYPIIEKDEKSF